MNKNMLKSIGCFLSIVWLSSCGMPEEAKLFDGKSLDGWEGSTAIFRAENEAIVGGNLKTPLDSTGYLCTEMAYEYFELKFAVKFISKEVKVNGGISFRAQRVPNSNEVMGYQADVGYIDARVVPLFSNYTPADTTGLYPLWGSLVDENRPDTSRYPKPDIFPVVLLKVADKEFMEEIIDPMDWNEITIRAKGSDIEIKINGRTTASFKETTNVPSSGLICSQAHAGGPYEVRYKGLVLKPL